MRSTQVQTGQNDKGGERGSSMNPKVREARGRPKWSRRLEQGWESQSWDLGFMSLREGKTNKLDIGHWTRLT